MTKKITESLVGKKPATASKLFAEAMEARLDEISKKTLGSYVKNASEDARTLENISGSVQGKYPERAKKLSRLATKRQNGVNKAVDRLTKEDLDESVDESYKSHPFYQKHFMHSDHAEGSSEIHHHDKQDADGTYHHFMIMQVGPNNLHTASIRSSKGNKDHIGTGHGYTPHEAIDRALKEYHGSFDDATHLKEENSPAHLSEVEAPANFWNAGMAEINPIQVSQKQPAEPGQFKATLTKSPKRLADQDSSLEGKPRAVRDETEATATSRGPKTIELTGDWHADVPDHQFDPKLDSETEYYPLFSQFKSLGAYPSGPARAWESEEIDESEKFDTSYMDHPVFKRNFNSTNKAYDHNDAEHHYVATNFGTDHHVRIHPSHDGNGYAAEVYSQAHGQRRNGWAQGATSYEALDKAHKAYKENYKMPEYMREDELNEISKKLTRKYVEFAIRDRDKHIEDATKARASADALQNVRTGTNYVMDDKKRDLRDLIGDMERKARNKKYKRERGIIHALDRLTKEDLDEDSASLMATATKDEKKAAEQDKKKPSEFKKLHDKHEAEVKSKMKELGEEALQEGLFDPANHELLSLWDEHARRADAHGSGSRNEILKRIEDHVAKKHGQEGLKKMKLHTDLSNALKHSLSPDKGHLQAILGNMRSRCAMEH